MADAAQPLAQLADTLDWQPAHTPIINNLNADITTELNNGTYWATQLQQPVRFADGITHLHHNGVQAFIEIGPTGGLTAATQRCLPDHDITTATTAEPVAAIAALAHLHLAGHQVDWTHHLSQTGSVDLPTYAFQRERYWLEPEPPAGNATDLGLAAAEHPMLGARVSPADGGSRLHTGRLSLRTHPWLADHAVFGTVLLPGAAFVELALHAAHDAGCGAVEELTVEAPLVFGESVQVQVVVGPMQGDAERTITIYARPEHADDGDPWTRHATGTLSSRTQTAAALMAWPPGDAEPVDVTDLYPGLADAGYHYGPLFQNVRKAWRCGDDVYAEVALPDDSAATGFGIHPALLDATLHPLALTDSTAGLPFSFTGVRLHAVGATKIRVRLAQNANGNVTIHATDLTGQPVIDVAALALRPIQADQLTTSSSQLYGIDWIPLQPTSTTTGTKPTVVYVPTSDEDPAAAAHASTHWTLDLLHQWLQGDDELVIHTTDPAAAGLIRTAQSEHPGRITLITGDQPTDAHLATIANSDEPDIRIDGNTLFARRLVRLTNENTEQPEHRTVLITGASGALASIVAEHLATTWHVPHLVLLSRRDTTNLADRLRAHGTTVDVVTADITDRTTVAEVIDGLPNLTGIIHTAGILDDTTIDNLTPERMSRVLAPKVDAAWHLHHLTTDRNLNTFVLFSSTAATFGAPGQGNYAAANAFLDHLAARRHAQGLAATSISWGLWTGGMADQLDNTDLQRLARNGISPLDPTTGLALLDASVHSGHAHTVAAQFNTTAQRNQPTPPLLRTLIPSRRAVAAQPADRAETVERWAGLAGPEREKALLDLVRGHVAAVLGLPGPASVEAERGFLELGLDSLTALELRNRLNAETALRLPATLMFDYPSPRVLADHLGDQLFPDGGSTVLAELEKLGRTAMAVDEATRAQVADHLRDLLARLDEARQHDDSDEAAVRAKVNNLTSDDEIFAFIDNELGAV